MQQYQNIQTESIHHLLDEGTINTKAKHCYKACMFLFCHQNPKVLLKQQGS